MLNLFGVQIPIGAKELLGSAAHTSTVNSADQNNDPYYRGLLLIADVSAVSGTTPTLDFTVQAKDDLISSNYTALLTGGTSISATGTYGLLLAPGAAAASLSYAGAAGYLPKTWRVACTIGGTTPSFTFSLVAYLIP